MMRSHRLFSGSVSQPRLISFSRLHRLAYRSLWLFSLALMAPGAFAQQPAGAPKDPPVEQKPKEPPKKEISASTMTSMASAGNPLLAGRSSSSARVGNSGAANLSIPIVVPPGTNAVQPNLSFTYNSQSQENEILGVHWQLSGLSTIERCPRTVAQDGFRGSVNYDANDRFCLDGARLILVSGSTYGADNTEYRTEIDSSVKIKAFGTAGNGPSYFKVWTKSGEVMEFGNSTDSKIEAAGISTVRVWALNKMQDVNGNYLTASYTEDNANGDYRPNRIDYTGNSGLTPNRSVQFFYENRTDNYPMYVGGSVIKTMQRLTNAKTYVGTTLVKDYRLTYQYGASSVRSRLTSITECKADGVCMPASTFNWQESSNIFGAMQEWVTWGGTTQCYTNYADFNGDGKSDFALICDYGAMWVALSTGSGFSAMQQWITWSPNSQCSVSFADFNGDGKSDFSLPCNYGSVWVALSTGSSFGTMQQWLTWSPNSQCSVSYADFDGDGKSDFSLPCTYGSVWVALSTGSSFAAMQQWLSWSPNSQCSVSYADFDGDGKSDFSLPCTYGSVWVALSTGSSFGTMQQWLSWSPNSECSVSYADFNGDGKFDFSLPCITAACGWGFRREVVLARCSSGSHGHLTANAV